MRVGRKNGREEREKGRDGGREGERREKGGREGGMKEGRVGVSVLYLEAKHNSCSHYVLQQMRLD